MGLSHSHASHTGQSGAHLCVYGHSLPLFPPRGPSVSIRQDRALVNPAKTHGVPSGSTQNKSPEGASHPATSPDAAWGPETVRAEDLVHKVSTYSPQALSLLVAEYTVVQATL